MQLDQQQSQESLNLCLGHWEQSKINEMVLERFLRYVKIWTTSDEDSESIPSTARQKDLGDLLREELIRMGARDVCMDENGYVYAKIPATPGCEDCTPLGFIAHMDTAPDFSGKDVKPVITEHYNGQDIALGDGSVSLTVKDFPHLKELAGRTLITADGTTLLGADDKAGVAEIMCMAELLLSDLTFCHGPIRIGFTPDEEIGRGADCFDLARFDAKFAYTLDGSKEGEIQFENFNAATAVVTVRGVNVHTGDAKDILVNAARIAAEFDSYIPDADRPETTEGYEGFFHLMKMSGETQEATLLYLIRDFDRDGFDRRCQFLKDIGDRLNKKYGSNKTALESIVHVAIHESYRNMKEKVEAYPMLIEHALLAAQNVGIEPEIVPIRGGTDGARLSFEGLPCPNLGTGGYAFHGPFEHITAEGMGLTVSMVLNLIGIYLDI